MNAAKWRNAGDMKLWTLAACLLVCFYSSAASAEDREAQDGKVFVMNNEASGNVIVMMNRAADGALTRAGSYATGGKGSGPGQLPPQLGGPGPGPLPLESQDALISARRGRFLLAVNAGSNNISVMEVTDNGLRVADIVDAGGVYPNSIAYHDGLVYVTSFGAAPTLDTNGDIPTTSGFFLDERGKLHPIPGSTRVIGESGAAPADVVFSPDGRFLVIAERITGLLDVFPVRSDGRLGEKVVTPSNNLDPFGMKFTHDGVLIVTEGVDAPPHVPKPLASTTSSYRLHEDGSLETISNAVPTFQTGACWVRFTKNQKFAFTVNSGGGSLSTYSISPRGELTLVTQVAGITGSRRSAPLDEDVTRDGKYLYVIAPLLGSVFGWQIEDDGTLVPLASSVNGFPISFSGIVAF